MVDATISRVRATIWHVSAADDLMASTI